MFYNVFYSTVVTVVHSIQTNYSLGYVCDYVKIKLTFLVPLEEMRLGMLSPSITLFFSGKE